MIENNYLEVKLKLCTSFIVKEVIALDPLARRQWLYTYKGIIQYADSHGNELTQEQIIGADIYRELIKQVEDLIQKEDYEGQNYNAYKSNDPNYETIYKKRLNKYKKTFLYLMDLKIVNSSVQQRAIDYWLSIYKLSPNKYHRAFYSL